MHGDRREENVCPHMQTESRASEDVVKCKENTNFDKRTNANGIYERTHFEREVAFALAIIDDFDLGDLLHSEIRLEVSGSLVFRLSGDETQIVGEESQIGGGQLQPTVYFAHAQRHVFDVEKVLRRNLREEWKEREYVVHQNYDHL